MVFDYFQDSTFLFIVEIVMYSTFFLHVITFIFAIFTNIESIALIRNFIVGSDGCVIVYKLNRLRVITILVLLVPLFMLKDVFFFTVITGSVFFPFLGILWPVS